MKLAVANGPYRESGRRAPSKGVHIKLDEPNWVFLTVSTEKRERWLAQASIQQALHAIWKDKATAWLVSDYLLMPDHIHLFCAPRDLRFTIERWIGFWKNSLSKMHLSEGSFQDGGFHHRLRNDESYSQKWLYMMENPVRHGLTKELGAWPFSGRVHDIHR
jgi:putative transposase